MKRLVAAWPCCCAAWPAPRTRRWTAPRSPGRSRTRPGAVDGRRHRHRHPPRHQRRDARRAPPRTGSYLIVNLAPGQLPGRGRGAGLPEGHAVGDPGDRPARAPRLRAGRRGRSPRASWSRRPARLLNTEQATWAPSSTRTRWPSCPSPSATGTTCWRWCPACRATASPRRAAAPPSAAPAASTCTARARCRTTSCSTAWTTTASPTNVQELTTQVSRPSIDAIQEFKVVTSALLGRVRPLAGRRHQRHHQVGHQRDPRHGLRLLPQRGLRRERLLLEARRAAQARQRPEPVRRQPRRAHRQGPGVLLRRLRGHAHHPRRHPHHPRAHRRRARRASSPSAVRDPADRPALPGQHDPGGPHRPRRRRRSWPSCPLPNQAGRQQLLPPAGADRRLRPHPGPRRLPRRASNDIVLRALHLLEPRPLHPRRLRRHRRRHGHLGLRRPDHQVQRPGGGLDAHLRADDRERVPLLLVAGARRTRCRSRSASRRRPAAQDPRRARPTRIVAGGLTGHHHRRLLRRRRAWAASARPTSCPSSSTRTSSSSSTALSWLRGNHAFKFGVDVIAPMKNEYMDVPATRGRAALPQPLHRQPHGRLPARLRVGRCSSRTCTWSSSGTGPPRSSCRTTGRSAPSSRSTSACATTSSRPPWRRRTRQTNFVPDGGGQLVFATDGSLEDRGLVKPDRTTSRRASASSTSSTTRRVLRGGYGIFYNLFDRVGSEDQLALNPPGLHQHQPGSARDSRARSSCCATASRPRSSSPLNLDPPPASCVACASAPSAKTRPRRRSSRPASASSARCCRRASCSRWTASGRRARNLAHLVNLNQPRERATARALPFPNFGFIEWRTQTRALGVQGHRPRPREALLRRLQLRRRVHARRLEGQHVRAPLDPGLEQLPAGLAQPRRVVRAQRLRRAPPAGRELRGRAAVRRGQEVRARPASGAPILGGWTVVGHLRRALGPAVHRQPEQQQRGPEHDRPAEPGRRPRRADETVEQWFNVAAFQAVPSGTFGNEPRNALRGPGWQSFDLTLSRRFGFGERVGAVAALGHLQRVQHGPTSACRTATSRTRPPWAPSPRWAGTRASCSSRCGSRSRAHDREGAGERVSRGAAGRPSRRRISPCLRRAFPSQHERKRERMPCASAMPP